MDMASYIKGGQKQLNNTQFYDPTDTDLTGEVTHRDNLHAHDILQTDQLSQSTCGYLTTDIDGTQQFYMLPKIHKDPPNPLGRPIVSGSEGPYKISQFVDHFTGHLVPLSQSFIRDSTLLINILNEPSVQSGTLLCTLDVTGLYTNLPHNECIQDIKEMLAIHRPLHCLPHSSYIVELLEVVLNNNYFEFNGTHYHQMSGTAVGTNWHLHMPVYSWPNLRKCIYTYILYNLHYGKDSLMSSS